MEKVYYYPPLKGKEYRNPYSANYRAALSDKYRIVNVRNRRAVALSLSFIFNAFRADVYIINWLENIGYRRFGSMQFLLVKLGLNVIRLRGKKIVWMFHNIHPHEGHSACSRWLHKYMFRNASLIISHSMEAADYARQRTEVKVLYVCHPVHVISLNDKGQDVEACDVFIWGSIMPYKGVYEFLQEEAKRKAGLRIHILGRCNDSRLNENIKSLCSGRVTFDNRRAEFEEIAAYIKRSRYVLFPYVGSCVSSSGALIDTLVMGGTPVGPSVGAFSDLAKEGMCLTYHDYDGLFRTLQEKRSIEDRDRRDFIRRNSWERLVDVIGENL